MVITMAKFCGRCGAEDIEAKNEFEKSIDYKITDSETVSMFCWQHGTVKPLCKAYKSEE